MEYNIKQNEDGQWVETSEVTETKVTTTHQGLKLYLKFLNDKMPLKEEIISTMSEIIEESIKEIEEIKEIKPKKTRKK